MADNPPAPLSNAHHQSPNQVFPWQRHFFRCTAFRRAATSLLRRITYSFTDFQFRPPPFAHPLINGTREHRCDPYVGAIPQRSSFLRNQYMFPCGSGRGRHARASRPPSTLYPAVPPACHLTVSVARPRSSSLTLLPAACRTALPRPPSRPCLSSANQSSSRRTACHITQLDHNSPLKTLSG